MSIFAHKLFYMLAIGKSTFPKRNVIFIDTKLNAGDGIEAHSSECTSYYVKSLGAPAYGQSYVAIESFGDSMPNLFLMDK